MSYSMLSIILDLPNGEEAVFWLSGSDLGSVNNYVWMTSGMPLNYTAWFSHANHDEPNQAIREGETEHCLSLPSYFNFKWNDQICSKKNYYVCDNQA